MTKKDYQLIADVFRENSQHPARLHSEQSFHDILEALADDLAYKLKHDNPRFDKKRFMEACGFPS